MAASNLPMKSVPDVAAWFRATYEEAPPGAKVRRVLKSKVFCEFVEAYGAASLPHRVFAHELLLGGFKTTCSTKSYISGWREKHVDASAVFGPSKTESPPHAALCL